MENKATSAIARATLNEWLTELTGYLVSKLGHSQPIDDLAQEAGLRLYRGLASGKVYGDPKAYLFQVARNLAVDVVRENLPYSMGLDVQQMVVCEGSQQAEEPALIVDGEPVWLCDLVEWLPEALAKLSLNHRRAIELHYVEGRSCQEMANTIGVSVDAAKVRLCRGRRALEKVLSQRVSRQRSAELAGVARGVS